MLDKSKPFSTACGPLEHGVKYYQGKNGYNPQGQLVWVEGKGPIEAPPVAPKAPAPPVAPPPPADDGPTKIVIGKVDDPEAPTPPEPEVFEGREPDDETPDFAEMTKAEMQNLALNKFSVVIPRSKSHAAHVAQMEELFS